MNRKPAHYLAIFALILSAAFFFGGCATMKQGNKLLPSTESELVSRLKTYDQAQAAFDAVRENETTVQDLRNMGIYGPNTQLQNFVELRNYFLGSNPSYGQCDLPLGAQKCLEAKEKCQGYVVPLDVTLRNYTGGFWKHVFGFKREADVTGWSCQMLFVIVDDVVVYKLWSGKPEKKEHIIEKKPLGPLQNAGESVFKGVFNAITD